MKILLIVFIIFLVGCSSIDIEHEKGELPKVKIVGAEEYCTEKLKARVRADEFVITCTIRL